MSVVLFDSAIAAYMAEPGGPVARQVAIRAQVGVDAARADVENIMHRHPRKETIAEHVRFEMDGPIAIIGIDTKSYQSPHPRKTGTSPDTAEGYLDLKALNEGSWLQKALDAIEAIRV